MIHPSEEILLGACPPSRSRTNSSTSSPDLNGMKLWGNLFKDISRLPSPPKQKTGYFEFLQSAKDNEANNLQLRAVDLKLAKNGSEEISVEDNINGAEVVLKCNTDFEFDLFFNKNICQFNDKLGICFEKENADKRDIRERLLVVYDQIGRKSFFNKTWPVEIKAADDRVTVKITIIPEVPCGFWRLVIYTGLATHDESFLLNEDNTMSNCVYTVSGIYINS